MTEGSEPIVQLGPQDGAGNFSGEFEFDYATDTGDALLRHVASGAEFRWSESNSQWELNQPLDLGANGLTAETVSTGRATFDGKPWHDVTAHGAEGDGETDDTDAIDAAHEAAGVGGTVYYPAGIYMRDYTGDSFPDGQTVILDDDATIKANPQEVDEEDVGLLTWLGDEDNWLSGITIIGGTLDGNKQNVTHADDADPLDTELIELEYVKDSVIHRCDGVNAHAEHLDLDYCERVYMYDSVALDCDGWGFHQSQFSINCAVIRCYAENCGFEHGRGGFDTHRNSEGCAIINCVAQSNRQNFRADGENTVVAWSRSFGSDINGLETRNNNALVWGGEFADSSNAGMATDSGGSILAIGVYSHDNGTDGFNQFNSGPRSGSVLCQFENNGRHGTQLLSERCFSIHDIISGSTDESISIGSGGEDCEIWEPIEYSDIDDGGTRSRFNGIIGGGGLGGVDLSTLTGASAGDMARSDGTSAADADVLAVFDGTAWRYPDSTATITP